MGVQAEAGLGPMGSSTFSVLRPLYFDSCTSNSVLRHFVKSGFLTGREAHVEVQFWSK